MTPEERRRREVAALQWMVKARDYLDEATGPAPLRAPTDAESDALALWLDVSAKIAVVLDRWNNGGDINCRPITMEEIEGK